MLSRGAGRVVKLLAAALILERLLGNLPGALRFVSVFIGVYIIDNLFGGQKAKGSPLFVEDVVVGLLLYGGLGYAAYWLDLGLWNYTHRHAGPSVPAVLWAVLDRVWPPQKKSLD